MFARAREMKQSGVEPLLANGLAWLEERVHQWPPAWGQSLHVLLYGDFAAPPSKLEYPSLGITVLPEAKPNTIVSGAHTVLEATVTVTEKSVSGLIDAARRINILLGVQTLCEWGNAGLGWWSWLTHGTTGGAITKLTHDEVEGAITSLLHLNPEVRRRVEAALFWVREPRNLFQQSYRTDVLRMYSAYWNAFECLVEAVHVVRPRPTVNKVDKQAQIDRFLEQRGGKLTAQDVQHCYQTIVNPSFVGKAEHALRECFPNEGQRYVEECFRVADPPARLYAIRNAINHGEIDAENPEELLRVEARFRHLWMIVWRMFACFVRFGAPVDHKTGR
jgi:hypothetical protein